MKYDYIISKEELENIRHLFWMIHCDYSRDDPEAEKLTYEVLKSLWSYQKYVENIS